MTNELTVVQALEAAYALIEDPARWTMGSFARDIKGYAVSVQSPEAFCFCSIGALRRVLNLDGGTTITCPLYYSCRNVFREINNAPLASLNDLYGHEEVMSVWKQAIAHAKQKEQRHVVN